VRDERLRSLAAKVRYEIDPDNPYPDEFTGHVRARLKDGPHAGGAPRAPARWPERAAVARRHRGEIPPQLRARRLAEGAHREPSAVAGKAFDHKIDLTNFRG